MGRVPRAEDRPEGGRTSARNASVEVRELSGNVNVLNARIEALENDNELRLALNERNYFHVPTALHEPRQHVSVHTGHVAGMAGWQLIKFAMRCPPLSAQA